MGAAADTDTPSQRRAIGSAESGLPCMVARLVDAPRARMVPGNERRRCLVGRTRLPQRSGRVAQRLRRSARADHTLPPSRAVATAQPARFARIRRRDKLASGPQASHMVNGPTRMQQKQAHGPRARAPNLPKLVAKGLRNGTPFFFKGNPKNYKHDDRYENQQ